MDNIFLELKGILEMHGLMYVTQYMLNINKAVKQLQRMSEKEKQKEGISKENEENLIEENELITTNSEIIDRLYKKFDELIPERISGLYDEDNKKDRYCLMVSSAAILNIDSINNEKWSAFLERIKHVMESLNTRDFITVLEFANNAAVLAIPCIQEIIKKRIPEMSDEEFFRLEEFLHYKNIYSIQCEKEISERIETIDSTFIPMYIRICHRPQDIEKLIDKAKPEDSIEIIKHCINANRFPGINIRILNLIDSLSNSQLVRLFIAIADVPYSNAAIDGLLCEKIKKLSKEELSYVVVSYLKSNNWNLRKVILDHAIKEGIIQETRGELFSNDPIYSPEESAEGTIKYNRYVMYKDYSGIGKSIKMIHIMTDFTEMLSRINQGEDEQELEKNFYENLNQKNSSIDIAESKVDYIRKLDGISDRELLIYIRNMKWFLKTNQAMEMLDERNVNMRLRRSSYYDIENYLYHRILEMKDKGAITLLSQLYDNIDNPNFNSIIAAKFDECKSEIIGNFEQSDYDGR